MSPKFAAGDLTIHRVVEEEANVPARAYDMLPPLTPELLAREPRLDEEPPARSTIATR